MGDPVRTSVTVGAVAGVVDWDPLLHQPDRRQHRLPRPQRVQGVAGGWVAGDRTEVPQLLGVGAGLPPARCLLPQCVERGTGLASAHALLAGDLAESGV